MKNDTRGMMSARRAVTLVVVLAVFGLVASIGLPVAINALEGDTQTTLNQTVGTDYDVNGELVSTVTAVDTASAPSTATVELNDTRTSGTTSNTINVGANETYSLNGGDVVVGVEEATANYAVANYSYATDYAYSGGASALWSILALAIMLAAFLYIIRVGLQATDNL